jgi:hypothetical protein
LFSQYCQSIPVIGVRIFTVLDSGLKFSGKKVILNYTGSLALYLVEMDSDLDPDRQTLDADPDPEK